VPETQLSSTSASFSTFRLQSAHTVGYSGLNGQEIADMWHELKTNYSIPINEHIMQ